MSDGPVGAPHELGRWGERRAAAFLEASGWTILARNYRFGRREVDLVILKGDLVAFVEVKTRGGKGFGRPEEAVTGRKRREIEAVARDFLARSRPRFGGVRFDVVAIVTSRAGAVERIEHLQDAWRPGWP